MATGQHLNQTKETELEEEAANVGLRARDVKQGHQEAGHRGSLYFYSQTIFYKTGGLSAAK